MDALKNVSRTQVVALVSMVTGVLSMLGLTGPADMLQGLMGVFTDDVFAALMVVGGAVTAALRMITKSPPAPGAKGLLLKDSET